MKKILMAGVTVGVLMLGKAGMVGAAADLPVLSPGWNLVGLMKAEGQPPMDVTELGDVTSVWKWTTVNGVKTWAVYLAGEGNPGDYALSKGFGLLDTINPGEGFWVNVPASPETTTTTTKAPTTTTTTLPATNSTEVWSFTSQDINYATLTFKKATNGIITVSGPISYYDGDYGVLVSGSPTGTATVNSSLVSISMSGLLQASNGLSAQCSLTMAGTFSGGNATLNTAAISCPSAGYYNNSAYTIYGQKTSGSGITP
jgi:hypothetical protein